MAIQFIDGFDHYGSVINLSDGVYASALELGLEPNMGPGGIGTALRNLTNGYLRKVLPGARSVVGVGQRLFFPNLPLANNFAAILSFNNGANSILTRFVVQSTGAIACYGGNGFLNLRFQTEPLITSNAWQHVEIKVDFSTGSMACVIGINSIEVFNSNNLFISPPNEIQQVAMMETLNGGVFWRMRDLYIWDNTGALNNAGMQGDRQVITSFPTSDNVLQDWTPSVGGVGWVMIDEVPPVDSDYVSANATGKKSRYGFTGVDLDITNISAVQVVGRMRKSDAGIGSFKFGFLSGATQGEGVEKGLSTEYTYYNSVFETDPNTGIKWTPAGVNAARVQLHRTS